jgi:hypothetical protein
VLEARQRFAPEAQLVLTWGTGIATENGVATDREQTFDFEVRPAFNARLACARENEKADCVPLGRIQVTFSSPVAWELASKIRLRAGERSWSAERVWADDDPLVDAIAFRGPFPPKTKLVAELPPDLRDDAGRTLPPGALETTTDRYPPLAKFSARFGVVEAAAPVLPVALRHVGADAMLRGEAVARAATVDTSSAAALIGWLHKLANAEDATSIWSGAPAPKTLALPPVAAGDDAEVVGIPLEGPACTSSRSRASCSAKHCSIHRRRCSSRRARSSPISRCISSGAASRRSSG